MIWSHVIALSLICGGAVAICALVGESAISAWRARRADRATQRAVAAAILTPDAPTPKSVGGGLYRSAAWGRHLDQWWVDAEFAAMTAGLTPTGDDRAA